MRPWQLPIEPVRLVRRGVSLQRTLGCGNDGCLLVMVEELVRFQVGARAGAPHRRDEGGAALGGEFVDS